MSSAKLLTPGGGGVILQPASSIASDVTVNVPVSGVNGGTLVSTDASGNVGIGTSSPGAKLHVSGGDIQVSAGSSLKYSATAYITPEDNVQGARISAPGLISMWTGATPTERARIDSSGRLLINSTGPIQGDAMLNVSSGLGMSVVAATNITATTGLRIHWAFYQNGQYRGEINSGNNTGVQYISASDYRLKEDVQPMTGALAKVAALKPVTYRWKSDGSYGDGFIAHELQEVCPEAVSGYKDAEDADGNPLYQGIDTSFLVATLTAAIQEQQAIINSLQDRIAALENA